MHVWIESQHPVIVQFLSFHLVALESEKLLKEGERTICWRRGNFFIFRVEEDQKEYQIQIEGRG